MKRELDGLRNSSKNTPTSDRFSLESDALRSNLKRRKAQQKEIDTSSKE